MLSALLNDAVEKIKRKSSSSTTSSTSIKGISESRLGSGYIAEAYGKHVIAGVLVSHEVNKRTVTLADNRQTEVKQIDLKVLQGKGEFDGLEKVTYDGVDIAGDRTQFFPGGATVENDRYFPNQIKHKGIARVSVSLPEGLTDDDDPTKMVAIVRCKKIQEYWNDGTLNGSPKYSTNPADQFVDAIRLDSLRKSVDFKERIDWEYYRIARAWYAENLQYPDYGSVPRNFLCRKTNTGSIPAGNYAVSVQAFKPDGSITIRTGEVVISLEGTYKAIIISGDPVEGANAYSIWVRRVNESTYYRKHVSIPVVNGKVEYTLTSLGNVESLIQPAGQHFLTRPRMESHCAFTSPTTLNEVLNTICLQSASDWQKVGKRYRILLPHNRPVLFHFNESNTMKGSFQFGRTSTKDRVNRIILNFREITDAYLRPAQPVHINRDDAQTINGIIPEEISLWGMSRHQAMRIGSYRMKQNFDRSLYCNIEDDGSAAHLLPGDIVEISDKGTSWDHKQFTIVEIEKQDSDAGGRRKYFLKEWYGGDYQDNDGNQLPTNGIQLNDAPSKFTAPKPIKNLSLAVDHSVKNDGTVSSIIKLEAEFLPHIVSQQGRLYHRKPGATDFQMVGVMYPDPTNNLAGFFIDLVDTGVHYFKVQTISSLGVLQTGALVEYSVNVLPFTLAPARPATATIERESGILRATWTPSTSRNAAEYLVTDEFNNEIARVGGTTLEEAVPAKDAVIRRVYTVSTTGQVSSDFVTLTYTPDYYDKRIVFDTPIGSDNFVPSGSDTSEFEEDFRIVNTTTISSYGSYNPDTGIWTRGSEDNAWRFGCRADREVAYGNCSISFKIPFATNAESSIAFGLCYGAARPTDFSDSLYGVQIETTALTVSVPKLRVKFAQGGVGNQYWQWQQGDTVTLKIENGVVQFLLNNTILQSQAISNIPYPLFIDVFQYYKNRTISPRSFSLKGFFQEIAYPGSGYPEAPPFPRPHWTNWEGLTFDSYYNLIRTTEGIHWGDPGVIGSGCFSWESYLGGCFLEFRHPGTASYNVVCGFNDVDYDTPRATHTHFANMNYCVMVGTKEGLGGLNNNGLRIYESGNLVFTLDQPLTTANIIRIAIENSKVRYRLNGILIYTSANDASPTSRWHVDTALMRKGDILPDVISGDVGSRSRGWRVQPNGVAEFGTSVIIGGASIDQVKARSITAIDASNRYRGNDFGVPETAKFYNEVFTVSGVYVIDSHYCYTDIHIDIPDSILKDPYANFDSVSSCRVRMFNYFGDQVANVEQSFSGRGKVVLGIHSRMHADPLGQALYSIEFKNNYGYSKPLYWANFRGHTPAYLIWYYLSQNQFHVMSSIPPPFLARTRYVTNVSAAAIDHNSILVAWATEQVRTDPNNGARTIYYRRAKRTLDRDAWVGYTNIPIGTTYAVVAGLAPDSEYEFLVHGTVGWEHSTYVIAKTLPPIHPILLSSVSPSGLSTRVDGGSQITLFWSRNAANNDTVQVCYADGTVIAEPGGGTTSWSVGGLAVNTTYGFKVRNKWNSGQLSEFSNTAYATTQQPPQYYAPSGLNGYASGRYAQLSWNKNGGDNAVVERDMGSGWVYLTTLGAGVQSYRSFLGYDSYADFRVKNSSPVDTPYSNTTSVWTEPDPRGDPNDPYNV